VKRLACAFLES